VGARVGARRRPGAGIERLGFGTLWVGGSPEAGLEIVETALAATSTLSLATGIVNIWNTEAGAVADSYHRLEAAYPGRFLLGIGAGHREHTTEYVQPYQALVNYLDVLDERGCRASGGCSPPSARRCSGWPPTGPPERTRTWCPRRTPSPPGRRWAARR